MNHEMLVVVAISALVITCMFAGAVIGTRLGRTQASRQLRTFSASELHLLGGIVSAAVRAAHPPYSLTQRLALRRALADLPMDVYTALDLEKAEASK